MTKLKELKARFMEDPEFREEYERVDEEYALIEALVRARAAAKLTGGACPAARHDAVRSRTARRRPRAAVVRHPPPLRRGNRHAAHGTLGSCR